MLVVFVVVVVVVVEVVVATAAAAAAEAAVVVVVAVVSVVLNVYLKRRLSDHMVMNPNESPVYKCSESMSPAHMAVTNESRNAAGDTISQSSTPSNPTNKQIAIIVVFLSYLVVGDQLCCVVLRLHVRSIRAPTSRNEPSK